MRRRMSSRLVALRKQAVRHSRIEIPQCLGSLGIAAVLGEPFLQTDSSPKIHVIQ